MNKTRLTNRDSLVVQKHKRRENAKAEKSLRLVCEVAIETLRLISIYTELRKLYQYLCSIKSPSAPPNQLLLPEGKPHLN